MSNRLRAVTEAVVTAVGTIPLVVFTSTGASAHPVPPAKPDVPPCPCGGPIYTWQNQANGKYLEIYKQGTQNGNWADVFRWNNGNNQKWSVVSLGASYGGLPENAYMNLNSDLCLEDRGYETSGNVDQWACGNFGNNDRFVYDTFNHPGQDTLQNLGNHEFACASSSNWVVWYPSFYQNPSCDWQ
jgi:hypothetical protein